MKSKTNTTTVAGAILALTLVTGSLAIGQTNDSKKEPAKTPEKAAATASSAAPTQIVFVPRKMIDENKVEGKLKENTFYWSNIPDDATQGPNVAQDGNASFLLLKGSGDEKTNKSLTAVTLIRAYNVPEGAKTARITTELKQSYDEWVDQNPKVTGLPTFTYSFFRNGTEARKDTKILLPAPNEKEWKTITTQTDVPNGAQQLVIVAKVDYPTTISIASLDVTFDTK